MKELSITEKTAKPPEYKDIDFTAFQMIQIALKKKCQLDVRVLGKSMNPILFEEDILTVYPLLSLENLKRFDVIIFWQNNLLICHYFWRFNTHFQTDSTTLLTRPLNPVRAHDHPIEMSQVLGIVPSVYINRWLRFKILFYAIKDRF